MAEYTVNFKRETKKVRASRMSKMQKSYDGYHKDKKKTSNKIENNKRLFINS